LPGLEKGGGEVGGCLGCVEIAIGILAEVETLLGGGERELHVTTPQRGGRAAQQVPHQRVGVAQQAGGLDAALEQLVGLRQLPALPQQAAQGCGQ
jgi:hypothetical protein